MNKIKTYIINLERRHDRRDHILKEFKNRNEFSIEIVKAIEDLRPALGLWKTITKIVENAHLLGEEYILICEDDHTFTRDYNKDELIYYIEEGLVKKIDILLGGVSSFDTAIQISNNLFWVNIFNGLQFTIIYKKFYDSIIESTFMFNDVSDFKISTLSESKMIIFPFISVQKEFGYSDVTSSNNRPGYVDRLFTHSKNKLSRLNTVKDFYKTD